MPNRFHILVVDDEPVQRELVGGFLKKQSFEVTLADSAERALELFRQDAFDLILTDQRMANMSGSISTSPVCLQRRYWAMKTSWSWCP